MPSKPKTTQPETPNEVQNRDTFLSPKYSVDLLIPFIPKNITHIWEIAAGKRNISRVLENKGYSVLSSDIDISTDGVTYYNFLLDNLRTDIYKNPTAIITNPPFSLKKKFIEKAFLYDIPFAFLIPFDMSGFMVKCFKMGCQGVVPDRRIDYITPTGKSGKSSASQFHSFWITWKFNLNNQLVFVDLSIEDKKNI